MDLDAPGLTRSEDICRSLRARAFISWESEDGVPHDSDPAFCGAL
jgi:hypothetical protein